MSKTKDKTGERIVEVVETCEVAPTRTFFCIYDDGFWMSREDYDRKIWTKDASRRREFTSREEAEIEVYDFLAWRADRERQANTDRARRGVRR